MQFGRQSSKKQSIAGHLNRRSRVTEPQLRRAAVGAVLDDSGGGDGAVDTERGASEVRRGGGRQVGGGGRRPLELRRQARHRGARAGCLARLTGVPSPLLPGGKRGVGGGRRGTVGMEFRFGLVSPDKGSSIRQNSGLLSCDPEREFSGPKSGPGRAMLEKKRLLPMCYYKRWPNLRTTKKFEHTQLS